MAIDMEGPNEDHTILLIFEQLAERTQCAEYPNGMDFTSDPRSHRRFFYERRIDIADQHHLYYTSLYGEGMKFTANPLLGLKWREEYELERAYSAADTSETLWAIAKSQVPHHLRITCTWFLRRARQRAMLVADTQRESLAEFLQLEEAEAARGNADDNAAN